MTQSKQDNEFKWLLPHSLVRLDNLVKHVSFVGANDIAFTTVHAIASSG